MLSCVTLGRLLDLSEHPVPGGLGRICGLPSNSKVLGVSTLLPLATLFSPLLLPPPPPLSVLSPLSALFSTYLCTQLQASIWIMISQGWGGGQDSKEKTPSFSERFRLDTRALGLPFPELSSTGRALLTSGWQAKYLRSS